MYCVCKSNLHARPARAHLKSTPVQCPPQILTCQMFTPDSLLSYVHYRLTHHMSTSYSHLSYVHPRFLIVKCQPQIHTCLPNDYPRFIPVQCPPHSLTCNMSTSYSHLWYAHLVFTPPIHTCPMSTQSLTCHMSNQDSHCHTSTPEHYTVIRPPQIYTCQMSTSDCYLSYVHLRLPVTYPPQIHTCHMSTSDSHLFYINVLRPHTCTHLITHTHVTYLQSGRSRLMTDRWQCSWRSSNLSASV